MPLEHVVQTPWIVCTGGPSSGKTTLVTALAEALKVPLRAELATQVIRQRMQATGLLGEEALRLATADQADLQWAIHQANLDSERGLDPEQPHVLDRGALDVVAYELHYAGGRHDQMVQQVTDLRVRYGYVFQLDLLPLAKNDVRIEDSETALSLDALYERIYREAGYDVVRVPVLPVAERMAFVLERCQVVLQRARANELTIEASCLRA